MKNKLIYIIILLLKLNCLFANQQSDSCESLCLSPQSNSLTNNIDASFLLIRCIDNNQDELFNKTILEYTETNGNHAYLELVQNLFKFTKDQNNQKKLINFLANSPSDYYFNHLNNAAMVNVFESKYISDSTFEELLINKNFRAEFNSLTPMLISHHKENPKITNFAKDYFIKYFSKFNKKNKEDNKNKEGNNGDPRQPRFISISGGTGASALMAEILSALQLDQDLKENESSLYIQVSHDDDGGSQFKLMKQLYDHGYGILPPLSDQVNALFTGFATEEKTKYILGNAGRIKSSDVTSAYDFTLNLLIKTALDGTVDLSDSFFTFASDILNAMSFVDQELVYRDILSLEKGSLRSLYFLGKLLEKGVLKQTYEQDKRNAIHSDDHPLVEKIMYEMSQNCGIEKAQVSICSYDQISPYAKYNEHILFVKTVDTESDDSITLSVGEDEEITYVKALGISLDDDFKGSFTLTKFMKDGENNKPITLLKDDTLQIGDMRLLNKNKSLYLEVEGKTYIIVEDRHKLSLKLVDLESKEEIEFARDGSGRLIEFENKQTKDNENNWVSLENEKILFRSSYLMMQTHITETANISGIKETGFLNKKIGFDDTKFDGVPDPNKHSEPNKEALNRIKNAQKGDYIFIGPGSTITSLLPHLNVTEIVAALVNAKKEGVQIVLVMNGTYDNETVGLSPQQILSLFEDIAKVNINEFISTFIFTKEPEQNPDKVIDDFINNKPTYTEIINEWLEEYLIDNKLNFKSTNNSAFLKLNVDAQKYIKKRYLQLLATTKEKMELEIRTDPSAASVASKKSYGVIYSNDTLEAKYKNIKIYNANLLSVIPFVDRKSGKIKYRAGYSPYELAKVLKEDMLKNYASILKENPENEEIKKRKKLLDTSNIDKHRQSKLIKKKKEENKSDAATIQFLNRLYTYLQADKDLLTYSKQTVKSA